MKSQSYPETIPQAYADNEILSRAYRIGWNRGHGIACHNVPTLGDKVFSESLGRITVDEENIREYHESLCFEAEVSGRDFSPFEFIASEFNKLDEDNEGLSDEAWEAYDTGVTVDTSKFLAVVTVTLPDTFK